MDSRRFRLLATQPDWRTAVCGLDNVRGSVGNGRPPAIAVTNRRLYLASSVMAVLSCPVVLSSAAADGGIATAGMGMIALVAILGVFGALLALVACLILSGKFGVRRAWWWFLPITLVPLAVFVLVLWYLQS